jgi:hypothetical protein
MMWIHVDLGILLEIKVLCQIFDHSLHCSLLLNEKQDTFAI